MKWAITGILNLFGEDDFLLFSLKVLLEVGKEIRDEFGVMYDLTLIVY